MASVTPNYSIPTYTAEDAPNLLDQYNAAMTLIDTLLLKTNGDVSAVQTALSAAQIAIQALNTDNTSNKDAIQALNTDNTSNKDAIQALQTGQTSQAQQIENVQDLVMTVNEDLQKQQVNGKYIEVSTTDPNFQVYKAENNAYFFLTGFKTFAAGNIPTEAIPGTTPTRYGHKICPAGSFPTQSEAKIYNNPVLEFQEIAIPNTSITVGGVIGPRNMAISSDGALYFMFGSNSVTISRNYTDFPCPRSHSHTYRSPFITKFPQFTSHKETRRLGVSGRVVSWCLFYDRFIQGFKPTSSELLRRILIFSLFHVFPCALCLVPIACIHILQAAGISFIEVGHVLFLTSWLLLSSSYSPPSNQERTEASKVSQLTESI